MNDVYSFCREINPYLAIVAMSLLAYRVVPTLFVLGWPTGIARILFAGYIITSALGAWENQRVGNSPIYVSLVYTILHLGVIALFSFWDFGLQKGINDRKRATGQLRTRKEDLHG